MSTQTCDHFTTYRTDIQTLTLDNLRDLIDIFIDSCQTWSTINNRVFSVIIYVILRMYFVKFQEVRSILNELNLLNIQSCHEWVHKILDEDDLCVITNDDRGKYSRHKFYEDYPELEKEAKAYVLENVTNKKSNFIVYDLVKFIDKRFRELYGNQLYIEINDKDYNRSKESCRFDLLT